MNGKDAARRRVQSFASRGSRATAFAILASAILAAVKILSGVFGNSYAMIADGIESTLDIMSSLVVLGSLRIAASPPNERFPYGYGKVEALGAMVISAVLLVAAAGIAVQSVHEIRTPHHAPAPFTLAVLVGVVAVKEMMFRRLSSTGAAIESGAMRSDAWHHRSDALTSLAAFVGITVALMMGPGYESADDWAALAACGVIVFNGVRLLGSALRDLLDAAAPPGIEEVIRAKARGVEGVQEIEKCVARKSGLGWLVDLHVEVDADISVRDGHEIAHRVKDRLMSGDPAVIGAEIHIEPHGRREPRA